MADTTTEFEATWYPRIGQDATERLRSFRRAGWFIALSVALGIAGGAMIGGSTREDAIGWGLVVGAAVSWAMFWRAQRRTAAAVGAWFGVENMRRLPPMRPRTFDAWRQAKGYRTPEERMADQQATVAASEQTD